MVSHQPGKYVYRKQQEKYEQWAAKRGEKFTKLLK